MTYACSVVSRIEDIIQVEFEVNIVMESSMNCPLTSNSKPFIATSLEGCKITLMVYGFSKFVSDILFKMLRKCYSKSSRPCYFIKCL